MGGMVSRPTSGICLCGLRHGPLYGPVSPASGHLPMQGPPFPYSMFPAPASGQPRPHAAAPRPSFPSHIWEVSRPHIRASASAGFGTGLCTAPFRQRPGICRCKARPSHTQCFLRLHPGSLAPMRQRPGLVSHPTSGKFPAPTSGHLPVRASARAFVRPRFASVRASADVRPALPMLNVSCARIRAALPPCGSAPALGLPSHIWKVSRPTSRHLPVRASARAFMRPRFASVRASADARPALPIFNVSCACIRAALPPCGSAPALDFPFHIWKVSRPTSGQPWRAPYPWIGMASSA